MLKTNHLQMPSDEWHSFHNLKVSLENAISSCSDYAFGSDVRWEIQTILENTEKKIQRILDKNFAVKPRDFDKYHIITWHNDCGEDDKDDCRTLSEAKKLAIGYFKDGYDKVKIICTIVVSGNSTSFIREATTLASNSKIHFHSRR